MSVQAEAEDILENIQPPLSLADIDEKTRQLASALLKNRIGFYMLGMGVGGLTAYFITKRLLETKYSKIADAEIAEMREHYQEKIRAQEAQAAKRPVGDIVKERGYSPPEDIAPPMAIQPPTVDTADSDDDSEMGEDDVEGPAGVKTPEVRNVFQEVPPVNHEWDWHEERKRRSPDIPYVIHYDERYDTDDYDQVTLTYYTKDDVVCDERDDVMDPDHRDVIIGDANLDRFGHGSNDPSIVYIRNDKLEIIYEVCKSPHSFAEEVHGFSHYSDSYRNLERMRARERDESED